VAIPMFLIIEQPDLGSGLMLMLVFVGLLYLTNVRIKYIFTLPTQRYVCSVRALYSGDNTEPVSRCEEVSVE